MTLPHFLKVWSALEGQLKGKLELILDVQRANWSSEGHLGVQIGSDSAASDDSTGQNGAQEAREGCTNGCTEPNLAVLAQNKSRHPKHLANIMYRYIDI